MRITADDAMTQITNRIDLISFICSSADDPRFSGDPHGRRLREFLGEHPGRDLDLGGGLRYHYLDEGEGEPVVMVHGNPTLVVLLPQARRGALRPTTGSIVPDHIGCGLSDKPGDDRYDYTLESRVGDLEALLDHLEARRRPDAGRPRLGRGDRHGLRRAAPGAGRAAGRPEHGGVPPAGVEAVPLAALALPQHAAVGAWLVRGLNAFCRGTAAIGCKHHTMPRRRPRGLPRPLRLVGQPDRRPPVRPGHPAPARRPRLTTWSRSSQDRLHLFADTPMLIAWGMRDFVFDRHFLAEWERHLPKAEVHRFPEAGHYVLEDEAEAVIPLVRSFLAAHPVLSRDAV